MLMIVLGYIIMNCLFHFYKKLYIFETKQTQTSRRQNIPAHVESTSRQTDESRNQSGNLLFTVPPIWQKMVSFVTIMLLKLNVSDLS